MSNQQSLYKKILVRLATPTSIGMGFLLPKWSIIITCEHIVRGSEEVIVHGQNGKALAKVLYLDAVLDIAFLTIPEGWDAPQLSLATLKDTAIEIPVWIADIPHGLQQSIIQTELVDTIEQMDKIIYLELDMPVVSDQSGCPVLDNQNQILGINSAMYSINDTFAFTLSSEYLIKSIFYYYKHRHQFDNQIITKCFDCHTLVASSELLVQKCPKCNAYLDIEIEDYDPEGIARTIEKLIQQMGYNIKLARKGPNAWEVEQGSATIEIIYNKSEGYIIGDAILCRLPQQPKAALYQYLLQQNNLIKGLNFSIKGGDVVLSVLIFERDLNMNTGTILFQNLFEQADYYDNILVEEYGGEWLFDVLI